MSNEIRRIIGEIEVHKIPVQIEKPVYKVVEKPDYVLKRQEVIHEIPKIVYKEVVYEKPIYKEVVYEKPVYKEVIYEIPKYVEKEYEIPKIKVVEKIVEVPKPIYKEVVEIKKIDVPIKVPKIEYENKTVINAVIQDKQVTNAVIKNVTVEALHPKYLCGKCKKEEINVN